MNDLLQLLATLCDPNKDSAAVLIQRTNNQLTIATSGIGTAVTASIDTVMASTQSKNMITALLVDTIFYNPKRDS